MSEISVIQQEHARDSRSEKLAGQQSVADWPRITLVTPVLNAVPYFEQTLRSVVFQDYPNLEYIVIDGGSDDGTIDIIRKYDRYLTRWVSENDNGMYDALNKGFSQSSGEIMGWISGTDMLHPRSLFVLGSVFRKFPDVRWITGIPTWFNEEGMTIAAGKLPHWSRIRFLAGANRYIQQESTFWRRNLWEQAGGYIDASRRIASDFELWVRFFRYAPLYTVSALIGGFRSHSSSLGLQVLEKCHRVHDEIIEAELKTLKRGGLLGIFRSISSGILRVPKFRFLWRSLVLRPLYELPGPDWTAMINYRDGQGWVLAK